MSENGNVVNAREWKSLEEELLSKRKQNANIWTFCKTRSRQCKNKGIAIVAVESTNISE